MTSSYMTIDGRMKYYTGCATTKACDDLEQQGTIIPLTDLLPAPASLLDQNCCDGQGCNGIRNAPNGRFMCMTCLDIQDPSNCDRAVLCGEHQECLYHEHLQFNDKYQTIYKYELKCQDRNICPVQTGSCHHSSGSSGCTGDYGCCTGDFCNLLHAMYKRNLTSSIITAGNVHFQTPGTQAPPTTTTATSAQPTAGISPPPTTTSISTQCYTGAGLGQVQLCTGKTPYCLTNLTNYNNGYREVFKGCANEDDCYRLPHRAISLSSHCDLFNQDVIYEKQFSCSYCCNKDLCNGRIVPPPETVFIPNTASHPIVVRNELNDVSMDDCRDVMSVNQCLVFPCDNEHLARIYCRNHCKLC
ncbi:uncharacterized protein LOC117317212 [Pecten maximus]|uniref:uncharacterized protein LOC117317212 n=1 Tax=Pecten maximus TaxID=6579 RepID=UPI0014580FAF|nr:uncharacterized protein LOC117317212 [Pecten maximus]